MSRYVASSSADVKSGNKTKTSHNRRRGLLLLSTCMVLGLALPATAGTIVTSALNLTGSSNGHAAGGYLITNSAAVTASNATFYNYRTAGGNGSGGGAALGGVFFVDSHTSLTLNNVTFLGNTAKGGNSVTGAVAGGTLNNLVVSAGNGANGGDGLTPIDNGFLVGDGNGNGLSANAGLDGANSVTGIGGAGGNGGNGEDGWSTNPLLDNTLAIATATVVANAFGLAADLKNQVKDGALCTNTTVVGPGSANPVLCAAEVAADIINLATGTDAEVYATGQVTAWQNASSRGQVGLGGDGGSGGAGGNSA